jgi:hypothetical protein
MCRFLDRQTVEVLGAKEGPTLNQWKAVLAVLGDQGVEEVIYRQYRNEQERTRRRQLKE